jgi:hypothetical protein
MCLRLNENHDNSFGEISVSITISVNIMNAFKNG